MKEISYSDIDESDYSKLTQIMTDAFNDDTKMHTNLDEDGPKGYNDGSLIRLLCSNNEKVSQKVMIGKEIIGAYVLCQKGNGVCELDMLFIDSEVKSQGIGFEVWNHIENEYTSVNKWVVETPEYSTRNYYFYVNKCGFHYMKEQEYENNSKSFIFEKCINR